MIVQLNKESIKNNGLTMPEVALLLFFDYEESNAQILANLLNKNFIKKASIQDITKTGVKYKLTTEGKAVLYSCLINSDKPVEIEVEKERLSNLAKQLKEIFPKGKKDGTNTYWSEGIALIIRRLKLFFKKYGNTYTDEQILNATKSYVQSFNGNYQFMRVLKYFIFKEGKGADGMIEGTSDLVNAIENAGQETINNDWSTTIV